MGNRTSQTIGTATTSFTYSVDDALTSTSTSSGGFTNSYTYNNAGYQTNRTLSGTSWTLTYDYEGQLLTTATGGSTVTTIVYDALGRTFSRANGGSTTMFFHGPQGVLNERVSGVYTAEYTYGNGLVRKDGEYPTFGSLGGECAEHGGPRRRRPPHSATPRANLDLATYADGDMSRATMKGRLDRGELP